MMTATTFALNPALSKKPDTSPEELRAGEPGRDGRLSFAVSANTPAANIGEFVALPNRIRS